MASLHYGETKENEGVEEECKMKPGCVYTIAQLVSISFFFYYFHDLWVLISTPRPQRPHPSIFYRFPLQGCEEGLTKTVTQKLLNIHMQFGTLVMPLVSIYIGSAEPPWRPSCPPSLRVPLDPLPTRCTDWKHRSNTQPSRISVSVLFPGSGLPG